MQSSVQLPRIASGAFVFVACCDLADGECHSFLRRSMKIHKEGLCMPGCSFLHGLNVWKGCFGL